MKTKKFYCKILLALLVSGLLPGTGVLAQQYEKSRALVQSYPTTDETSVQIINKYGNIHVLPWEEDSIRFEINIKVEANKQSKTDKQGSGELHRSQGCVALVNLQLPVEPVVADRSG